jgi:cation:H+ antiporter
MTYVEIALGLALLLGGGEFLVKGSVALAYRLGIPPLVIGLTLVGFGTSTPELVASLNAALRGYPGIAVGNVVGSNIANILLILGMSAIILPVATTKEAFRRDGGVLLGSSALLLALVLWGTVDRWMGLGLVTLLFAYTGYTLVTERLGGSPASARVHEDEAAEMMGADSIPLWRSLVYALGGILGVLIGAHLLVQGAVTAAEGLGVSQAVIGLTLVSVGTSLPEMATSVMAALRRHSDVAFGNLVGSNIFNTLGILGVTAAVTPLQAPAEIVRFDIWVMVGTTILLVVFATTGWRVSRREGAVLLAAYAGYLFVQFSATARATLGL